MTKFQKYGEPLLSLIARPLVQHGVFLLTMVALAIVTTVVVDLPHSDRVFFAFEFFVDLYCLGLLLSLLPRTARVVAKGTLYVVAYGLSLTEVYLFYRFRLTFSPTMLNLLVETNGGESREFLMGVMRSKELWRTLLLFAPILLGNLFAARWGKLLVRRLGQQLPTLAVGHLHRASALWTKVLLPLLALAGLCIALPDWVGEKQKMWQFLTNKDTRQAEAVPVRTFYAPHYRLLHAAHFLHIARGETERLMERMENLKVDSCTAQCPNIVVIIGESYNKHHAALYGYRLNTTPYLSRFAKRGHLVKFDQVISPWNVTSQAFKSFLSTQSADEGGAWTDGVLFPAVFRRSGYRVCFVTNQFYRSAAQGVIDFNGSFFLNDARMDSLCFDHRNTFRSRGDVQLTHLLRHYQPAPRNLYLLHLYGQHMEYDQRYPKEKAVFSEHDILRPDLTARERRIVAHYDNATLHNDECVARIMAHFRKEDALVLYFSDHGEEVYDGQAGRYGRNHTPSPDAATLRAEYEVPFMFWSTPTFRRRHPAVWRAIRAAQHRPFSTDDLPHLLFGLAGIQTPYYRPERDLLSPHFRAQRRWVKEKVDYDQVMQQAQPTLPTR